MGLEVGQNWGRMCDYSNKKQNNSCRGRELRGCEKVFKIFSWTASFQENILTCTKYFVPHLTQDVGEVLGNTFQSTGPTLNNLQGLTTPVFANMCDEKCPVPLSEARCVEMDC